MNSRINEPYLKMNDPILGERIIPLTGVGHDLALIVDQCKLLNAYKNDGRKPSQKLLDDIAAYEAIINSNDPVANAIQYFEVKYSEAGKYPRPREVIKKMRLE